MLTAITSISEGKDSQTAVKVAYKANLGVLDDLRWFCEVWVGYWVVAV